MTPRRHGETQRAYVERALRTDGHISAWDCYYNGQYADGGKWSITRLAAIIWTLRHEAGWVIDDEVEPGRLAVYRVRRIGHGSERPRTPPPPAAPTWAQGWACARCGSPPSRQVEERLGGMGASVCICGSTVFRRAA